MKEFRIAETDLVDLERILPEFQDTMILNMCPRLRTQIRRIKEILSNVRWGYGPFSDVTVLSETDEESGAV